MKTAKQYFKESYENVSENATLTILAKNLFKVMEGYAQYKVNELNKSDVIKSVCECEVPMLDSRDTFSRCNNCHRPARFEQTVL